MREVAVGIVENNDTVLVCQRKKDARYGLKWEFPGGKLESGESPDQAVARELYEELSIHIVESRAFHCQEWTYAESAASGKDDGSFRVHYFLVTAFLGTPHNLSFEDIRWVSLEELSTMDILEGNREAVALLRKRRGGRPHAGS